MCQLAFDFFRCLRLTAKQVQYLDQLEKDWSRQRVIRSVEQAADGNTSLNASDDAATDDSGVADDLVESKKDAKARAYLDRFVQENASFASYAPQNTPECLGEFLDSRFMVGRSFQGEAA
jgi:hypothetical protein